MLSFAFLVYLPLLTSAICNGHFETVNNVCKFACYDGTYEEISSLTFDEIRDECDAVMDGYRWNRAECSDKDDLVWSTSTSTSTADCECPYCGCSTEDTVGESKSWTELISKRCKNCKCTTHPYDTTYSGNIYQCETTARVSDPYNWEDFTCPAAHCTDTVSQETHLAGEAYFADVDADEKCEKFCYCKFDGTSECQTGFSNIINHGSEQLKAAFYDECEWEVQGCANSPARMYSTDQGPSCSSWGCPKCTCNGNTVGDVYWHEYESQDEGLGNYPDSKTCARCECRADSLGVEYADCDDSDSYPINGDGTYTCPGSEVISCHSDDGWGDCAGTTCVPELKAKSATINSREYQTNQPEAWCTNSFEIDIESNDDDDVWWDWGSDTGPFCAIWGTHEQCGWYSYSISWEDCYGDTRIDSRTTYEYCCNTDNCNYIDINMNKNTCTENTEMSDLLKTLYECIYTGNGRSGWIGGDCETLEEEIVSCTSIKNLYEDQANCLCKAYKGLYDAANSEWKKWIKDQIDMFMTTFTEWNDVLNCPGRLECNLDDDDPEVRFIGKANHKVYFVSVLFTFMVGLIMFN